MAGKRPREYADRVGMSAKARQQCKGDWSSFKPIISRAGNREGNPNNWARRESGPQYYNSNYRSNVPDTPGVYELATTDRRGNREVVYVGETSNLHDRLGSYMSNGSHLRTDINRELRNGSSIDHRYRVTSSSTVQKQPANKYVEKDLLGRYDYGWNIQRNTNPGYYYY